MAEKFYLWEQVKDFVQQYPNEIAVLDLRTDAEVQGQQHVNGGKRVNTLAELKGVNDFVIYGGDGWTGSAGSYNSVPVGKMAWRVRIAALSMGNNQLWGYFMDENGWLWDKGLLVAKSWSTAGPIDPNAVITPNYAYSPQALELQDAPNGNAQITFSNNGGYIGADKKGGYRMGPLVALDKENLGYPIGAQWIEDWGAVGGVGYLTIRFGWIAAPVFDGSSPPPQTGDYYLSIYEGEQEKSRIYGVDPSNPDPATDWLAVKQGENVLRKFIGSGV